jgi:hypothetical protein
VFRHDDSLLSAAQLWTLGNIQEFNRRYLGNPIEGTDQNFLEKLKEQLSGAPTQVIQLAAETIWFLHVFPVARVTKPETKRDQIKEVWAWSGSILPDSPYLSDDALSGVGHPGTFYLTNRYRQLGFLLSVLEKWKALTPAQRDVLLDQNAPWNFMEWLDTIEEAERLAMRNAILYFLFPDDLERNLNNDHRKQIVKALKHRIPEEFRPKGENPPLRYLDRAIRELRKGFEEEFKTKELDFYRPPIHAQWWTKIREDTRREIAASLKQILTPYHLELQQCGSKKKTIEDCRPVDTKTGFWTNPTDATSKPLRWILHLALVNDKVVASVPNEHGARRIAFATTHKGTSGAVTTRIVPAIKVAGDKFIFYEVWEWLLLHCFLPALPTGSGAQLFDHFDEKTGKLTYMGNDQPYVAAALITLNEDDDLFVSFGVQF